MEWCQQCGVLNRPEPAIGVDDEGDPACGLHAMKRNDPEVQTSKAKLDAIRRPAPTAKGQIAPPVKEKSMPRAPKTFAPRTCICGCNQAFVPTGSTQRYMPGHKPKPTAVAVKTPKKAALKVTIPEGRLIGLAVPGKEPNLVDLGKLKRDLQAKLAAIELIEQTVNSYGNSHQTVA
jgi:hypothetical protein